MNRNRAQMIWGEAPLLLSEQVQLRSAWYRVIIVFIFISVSIMPLLSLAQTGPGGVGDTNTNTFWLDANEITGYSDGDDLDRWLDVSGNGLDLSQPVRELTPEYKTGILNGYPSVRFNKTQGTYGRLRRTGLNDFPKSEITQFIVNANQGESNDGITSYASSGSNNDFLIFNSSNLSIYRNGSVSSNVSTNDGRWHIINPSWRSADGDTRLWLDGTQRYAGTLQTGATITSGGSFAIAGEQDAIDANYAANQAHLGDFAEVLVYNFRLNAAQRIIVNNYLAAKYAISLAGNDYYAYESSHSIDVAGIGRETAAEVHTAAMSDDVLEVSNPSGLNANQEYLLFGHDGRDVRTTWRNIESPDGGQYINRLSREWRFSEINGDVGLVDIMVNVSTLPALPAGFSSYGIMIDTDGDFSSGATVYELGLLSGSTYTLSALDIRDGDHLAIVAIDPQVNFSSSASDGFEPSNANITLGLNYVPRFDVTVDYSTADGSATAAQPDYTAVIASTATIAAGTSTTTINIIINDEAVVESDETFTITLSNPAAGVDVGTIGTHTYTIHDDDDARKIYFDTSSSSGLENLSTPVFTISMSSPSATDVSVDYAVTGGTASEGIVNDFNFATGTVTIPGGLGLTSGTFTISINDDAIYENDETVVLSLSNPIGCNLDLPSPDNVGTGISDHTYTILENDSPPIVAFASSSSAGAETSSPAMVLVALNTASAVTTSISYLIADGTALAGSDYLASSGTVTIAAGATSANILATIIDNGTEELPETFSITMTSAIDATLGATLVHTYTIIDNDTFGHTGPGGIGDANNNKLWISADQGVYDNAGTAFASNGDAAQQWNDRSGNSNDLSQPNASYRPTYATAAINGLPAMRFNVNNNRMRRTGFDQFPTSSITSISVMNTTQDGDAHLSYAVPGDFNNYLLFNSGNQTTFIGGSSAASGHSYADGAWHILQHTWESRGGENILYEDGTLVYSGTLSAGRSITAGGVLALGGEQDALDNNYDAGQDFDGEIAETIIYNIKINAAQQIILENYLGAKYGLAIRTDLFSHEATYGSEVAGIGRIDINNFHQDARGSARMRILSPDDLDDNEFLIWGHDNGVAEAIEMADVPASMQARFDRVWRANEVSSSNAPVDVGSIDMRWDLAGLGDIVASDLRLLIDTDNDGLFSDETPIGGATDLGGDIYQFENISAISNNLRFTIGTINSTQTPLPIELVSFTAKTNDEYTVRLDWETASETNNDFFTIERSANGLSWEHLLEINGAGNSSSSIRYSDFDYRPLAGTSYYRLKQTDYDGQFEYSEAAVVHRGSENIIVIYPNPVTDIITLQGESLELESTRILNTLGQDVTSRTHTIGNVGNQMRIDLSGLSQGTYLIQTRSTVSKVYKE